MEYQKNNSLFVVIDSPRIEKTTVVFRVFLKNKTPYILYNLDDNDPKIFSKYLVYAIESKGITIDKTVDRVNIYEAFNFTLNYFE